jgi:HAD superfamily hydrolase (TIGR01549 family)
MRNRASGFVEENFGEEDRLMFRREMEKFLCSYELSSAEEAVPFDDCVSTLEQIRKLGGHIGLVTNTSKRAVDVVFKVHNLGRFFDVVVTRDSVKRLKPDPEGILMAVKKLGSRHFYMVGDLILDVLAAKSAGVIAILVNREDHESDAEVLKSLPQELLQEFQKSPYVREALRVDYTVRSLCEIPAIIRADRLEAH